MSLYNTTLNQPYLFAAFLYLGMLAGAGYSLFRRIRSVFGKSRAVLVFGDVLFFVSAAGGIFFAMYRMTGFRLRGYYFLGAALGFLLYTAAFRPMIRWLNCKFRKKKIDNSRRE